MRRPAWVIVTYAVLLLLAVAMALSNFLPSPLRNTLPDWATSQTVSLGLDLQGGAHLLLAVDRDDLAGSRLQELRETLAAEMRTRNLNPGVIRTEGLALSAPADDTLFATMRDAAAATAQPGSPSDFTVDMSEGTLRLALTDAGLDRAATMAADSSLEVIRHRVDQVGVLAMLGYIWLRFEWHFAAGAILVLFLDVTKTFGVIAITGWEVNLTTIVALLTLIGYSVNDKVVVYDRIREHLRGGGDAPLAEVIDRSLNQVLARCLFTSGTTLAALLPMAIWGGPAVAGFAWPMIAGVVIATGSSLFVSEPVLAWLAARTPTAMNRHTLQQAN